MGTDFFVEREILAVNFGGAEILGKFSSIIKDDKLDISYIVLKDAVMILTQMTDKGLAHNMVNVSEGGNFSDEIIISTSNITFVRRVSPLGELYRKYIQITSKIALP